MAVVTRKNSQTWDDFGNEAYVEYVYNNSGPQTNIVTRVNWSNAMVKPANAVVRKGGAVLLTATIQSPNPAAAKPVGSLPPTGGVDLTGSSRFNWETDVSVNLDGWSTPTAP